MTRIAIIGSGLGGLTAGNLLARKGHQVTIFESHHSPGGYTAGFRRQGFYFESGTLSFESSEMVFPLMREIGVFDRVEFVRQPMSLMAGALRGTCRSFADFQRLARQAFPAERAALDRYFGEMDRMIGAVMALSGSRGPGYWPALPFRLARLLALYRRHAGLTSDEYTARFFPRGSFLYNVLKEMGYPKMSAAILPMAYASFFDDYWTVKSGMQSWADALVARLRESGGELRLNARVDSIVTRRGKACGVETSGGFHRADWVVSAADYKKTFLQWLDDPGLLPVGLRQKISATSVSEGVFTVYLGLEMDPGELAGHLGAPHASCRDPETTVDIFDSADRDYFRKAHVGLYAPCLHDPQLAPPGRSGLMLQAVAPYRWMDNWGNGDRKAYLQLKEEAKQALIATAARFIPGLAGRILFSDAATPLTYERYTGNSDGATSAWSWNPGNRFYRSIFTTRVDTPVPGLLVGSCWANQIGGVPGALLAARKCARRIGGG